MPIIDGYNAPLHPTLLGPQDTPSLDLEVSPWTALAMTEVAAPPALPPFSMATLLVWGHV